MQCLFLKAFKRHTIVDLDQVASTSNHNVSEKDCPQSIYRNDSRKSSNSKREESYRSDHETDINKNQRREAYVTSEAKRPNTPNCAQRRYYCPNAQALYRAYSFDKHLNKRKSGDQKAQSLRRTRSAERLPNKEFVDRESEFRNLYHKNWEQEPFDFHRAHVANAANDHHNKAESNKHTNPNNDDVRSNEQSSTGCESKERRFKRGKTSRRGIKHVADVFPDKVKTKEDTKPTDYTKSDDNFRLDEQPQQKDNFVNKDETDYQKQFFPSAPADHTDQVNEPATPYIVEEPPDSCPVCLESIPCRQARRLSCSHSIHTCCLIELLNKMDFDFGVRCPVCNQITRIQNYYIGRHLWYKELPVVRD